MTAHLAHRLHGIEPTIFSTMSALALRTAAINLGQGFPDTDGPVPALERARAALLEGRNQYAPGIGVPELREAVAAHQQRHYGIDLDPDTEVVVTTGATEAISSAILGLVDPGDEVVVLEPFYDSYAAMLHIAGAVCRGVPLRAPDFRLDGNALAAAVHDGTKLILLNTPHNPTGTVLDASELALVAELAVRHDVLVVTDEVYEHLTFDGRQHTPIATLPGMAARTLTISSLGKSWSLTGWKIGWASGPADLVGAVLAAKQWTTFTSGSPLQPAAAYALEHCDDFPRTLAHDLTHRRDVLAAGLHAAGLEPRAAEGTYFTLTDVSHLGWTDGAAFCAALPERAGVVAIPLQGFYCDPDRGRHLVRWAFCKDEAVIIEGVRRLGAADLRAAQ